LKAAMQVLMQIRTILEAWRNRGSGWKDVLDYSQWTPSFGINAVRLSYLLTSPAHLRQAIMFAERLIRPMAPKINITLPCATTLRLWGIKIDLVAMAYERHRHLTNESNNIRVAKHLMTDASPQLKFDYFGMRVEEMRRHLDKFFAYLATANVPGSNWDPRGGFKWNGRFLHK
jgi:hypothetical protein